MNRKLLSTSHSEFPTYGFVEVAESRGEDGEYKILKKSTPTFDPSTQGIDVLFALYKTLHKDMIYLEFELGALKRKANNTERWDRRYTKRMAVSGNIILGIWIFVFQFIKSIRGNGKVGTKLLELLKVCTKKYLENIFS